MGVTFDTRSVHIGTQHARIPRVLTARARPQCLRNAISAITSALTNIGPYATVRQINIAILTVVLLRTERVWGSRSPENLPRVLSPRIVPSTFIARRIPMAASPVIGLAWAGIVPRVIRLSTAMRRLHVPEAVPIHSRVDKEKLVLATRPELGSEEVLSLFLLHLLRQQALRLLLRLGRRQNLVRRCCCSPPPPP